MFFSLLHNYSRIFQSNDSFLTITVYMKKLQTGVIFCITCLYLAIAVKCALYTQMNKVLFHIEAFQLLEFCLYAGCRCAISVEIGA